MEKTIQLFQGFFGLSTEQQIFIVAVLAISVTGFALYVVLAALNSNAK